MTLVEFLAPLRRSPHRQKILAILYFVKRYEQSGPLTVEDLRAALARARIPGAGRINVADVLSKAGHLVDTAGERGGRRLWELTDSGEQYVRKELGLIPLEPAIEQDASSLMRSAAALKDAVARDFIEEGIRCLQVGALRAAVVFIWSAVIRKVQEGILDMGNRRTIADSFRRQDPSAKVPSRIEDFAYVKDKTTLLVAREVGALDKGQKDTLEEALSLRNRCGHPTRYRPGLHRVSGFVEDVIGIAFE